MQYTMAQIATQLGVEVQTANKYRRKAEVKYGCKFGITDTIDKRKTYYTQDEFEKICEFVPDEKLFPQQQVPLTSAIVHSPQGMFTPAKMELPATLETDLSARKQLIEATTQVNSYAVTRLREYMRQVADSIVDNVETTMNELETYLINDGIAEVGKKMSESSAKKS